MRSYNLRPRNPHGHITRNQTFSTITLRRLPPELRDLIFKFSLLRSGYNGKTPPLLVALRQDKEVYLEAVRVYYAVNEFGLYWGRGLDWVSLMREEVRGLIRRVVVVVPTNQALIPQLHDALALLPALRSLKIQATNTTALQEFDLPALLQSSPSPSISIPNLNSKLKFITELTIEATVKTERWPSNGASYGSMLRRINDEFKAEAGLVKLKGGLVGVLGFEPKEKVVSALDYGYLRAGRMVLSWKAEKGKVLLG